MAKKKSNTEVNQIDISKIQFIGIDIINFTINTPKDLSPNFPLKINHSSNISSKAIIDQNILILFFIS